MKHLDRFLRHVHGKEKPDQPPSSESGPNSNQGELVHFLGHSSSCIPLSYVMFLFCRLNLISAHSSVWAGMVHDVGANARTELVSIRFSHPYGFTQWHC